RTVLISSHILTEMADFCTSIGILEEGRLPTSGRVADILDKLQPGLRLDIEVAAGQEQLLGILKSHASINQIQAVDGRVHCRWSAGREALPELHRRLVQEGVDVISFALKAD